MSCHEIGPAIGHAINKVLEEFDKGTIDLEVARRLGVEMRPLINYCDGNEYEIFEVVKENRCGYCLMEHKGEIRIEELSYPYFSDEERAMYPVLNKLERRNKFSVVTPYVCRECFFKSFQGKGFSDEEIEQLIAYLQSCNE